MKKFLMILALFAFIAPAHAATDKKAAAQAPKIVDTGWTKRCPDKKAAVQKCEIFSKLEVEGSKQRVIEVALGFPAPNKEIKDGEAQGVIILPLGVLLPTGASIQVDDGKLSSFMPRFCNNGGCFSVVKFDKDLLASLSKGKQLNVLFKTAEGRNVKMSLALKDFDKAVSGIK